MSDDNNNKKIVWKKGNSSKSKSDNDLNLGDDVLHDLARRSGDDKSAKKINNGVSPEQDDKISSLQDDIQKLMNDIDINQLDDVKNENIAEKKTSNEQSESIKNSDSISAAISAIDKSKGIETQVTNEIISDSGLDKIEVKDNKIDVEKNKKLKIDSIKDSILKDFDIKENDDLDASEVFDEQTKKLLEQKEKTKGIDKTYYSDLSKAMGSNKPATMSELLEKSRYEKREKSILSISSKKNIAYIVGALLLLVGIVWLIFTFIGKKTETIKYITKERVKSLVYSDGDTGINVTNIDSEQTKQAIRTVLETELKKDEIRQIYYVKDDEFGNKRRIGVKQVFESTDNIPPELLYQNIENDFMHGFYRTDKNYPFIILKALSYDRAFEGMKEWEPTMIDDLSTYLDLPKEAGDRSLMEEGFSDDLIKNKIVRVARFLPRDIDRRGILDSVVDFFSSNTNEKENDNNLEKEDSLDNNLIEVNDSENKTEQEENIVSYLINFFKKSYKNLSPRVYAQSTSSKKCYKVTYKCTDFYGDAIPYESTDPDKICYSIIHNRYSDPVYPADKEGQEGFTCLTTIDGSTYIDDSQEEEGENVLCYKKTRKCINELGENVAYDPNDLKQICHFIIANGLSDNVYQLADLESYTNEYIKEHYSCINTIGGNNNENIKANETISGDNELIYSRNPLAWIGDMFPDGLILQGGPLGPGYTLNQNIVIPEGSNIDGYNSLNNGEVLNSGSTLNLVELIQNIFVDLGAMETISVSGEYDLLTQEIITGFQGVNGLDETGIIDQETINILNNIISGVGEIFGGSQAAIINDYIPTGEQIGIGTYSEDVQTIQILLFSNGYQISDIDGIFDGEVCNAILDYENDNGLIQSNDTTCILSTEIINSFNMLIENGGYLGSGFVLNGNGDLIGSGVLQGKDGPGFIGFEVNKAEADSLKEGEVVLIYTFLDEKTILITRHESVITEIIKRRAFNDIFNKS